MNNYLILRTLNSPYNDVTKGATLTFSELDDNFIFLKGHLIYTSETIGNTITLKKYNGEDISFTAATGGGGSDTYWISGSTGTNSIKTVNTSTIDATGNYAVAMNNNTLASGLYSFASGSDTTASGATAHAEGSGTIAGGVASHAEGGGTFASGYGSHAEGDGSMATGDYGSHAEGYQSIATGWSSHAQGNETSATTVGAHSEGDKSLASGSVSHAEGSETLASGAASHAEGGNTIASGDLSHAEGLFTLASGNLSHAEGGGSEANGTASHAQGYSSIANGDYSFAGGFMTTNNADTSFVFGRENINDGEYSNILGGYGNNIILTASSYSSIIQGNTNTIFNSDTASIINGYTNSILDDSKQSTIVNGQFNTITTSQFSSIIGGNSNEMTDSDGSAIIGGSGNLILSDGNPAFTRYYNSILGGTGNTINNSELSFIMGGYQNVIPYGKVGVVILGGDSITGSTNNTVYVQRLNIKTAVNDNTTTRFLTLDANNNIAFRNLSSISGATSGGTGGDSYWVSGTTGTYSLKQLNDSGLDATANYAIAMNNATTADGVNSFAAGYSTWARGLTSTAIGQNTEAFGDYTFAGGHNSKASGTTSFVWSTESTAFGDRSAVIGGSGIAGNNNDTVYVPYFNIQSASTDNTLSSFLVRNGDGSVKTRTLDVGTPFYLQSSPTTDAGSNKNSNIQRGGGMFIGDYVASSGTGSFTYVNKFSVGISHSGYTYFNQNSYQNSPNDSGSLGMYRQRGTSSAPLNLLYNDKLGDVKFTTAAYGISGGSQSDSFIGVYANENHSGTTFGSAMGTRMDFYLIPNGTTSARKALTIIGSGDTRIFGNLTASTVSATTYYNLPSQASVTGFTYSNNNLTINQTTGDLSVVVNTMTGLTINGNLTYSGQANNPVYTAGTVTATHIPNWNNSNIQTVILSAATTSISGGTNIANGAIYTMILKQNATGSRVVTWGTQYKWQSGIAPILTATANGVDILTFISDGTNLYGLIAKDFR